VEAGFNGIFTIEFFFKFVVFDLVGKFLRRRRIACR